MFITNMRSKVCSYGMSKAEISQQVTIAVAKDGKTNGTNLNIALVENVVDKQNVAFAEKILSREVEEAMKELDYQNEAPFCRRFRDWYKAQDEGGMSCHEMHIHEQDHLRYSQGSDPLPSSPDLGRFFTTPLM